MGKINIRKYLEDVEVLNLSKEGVLSLFPSFMRPGLIKLYRGAEIIKELPRALYLRLDSILYLRKTKRDFDGIMRYLDHWVLKRSANEYVPEDFLPTENDTSAPHGIQQVRREISEFVRILLLKGLDNNILEIGLGCRGGTHILWRQIFNRVVTIESASWLVKRFKLSEWLDSRSTIIVGRSEDPNTLERVRSCLDSVDVLFIDGDHKYESVARDWAMYHNLVRPGGVIAFHDSVCKVGDFGVAKFLEDLSRGTIDNRCHTLHNIVYSDHVGISYEEC